MDPIKDLTIETNKDGNRIFKFDDENSVLITKIYDNDKDVLHIYTEDGACFEVDRNSKFGTFINRSLRKEKLKKIDGNNRNPHNIK